MRRVIESLSPGDHISWRWVGGMFALYVVLMVTAVGVFVSHESSPKMAREAVTTVASEARSRSIVQTSIQAPVRAHRVADNF